MPVPNTELPTSFGSFRSSASGQVIRLTDAWRNFPRRKKLHAAPLPAKSVGARGLFCRADTLRRNGPNLIVNPSLTIRKSIGLISANASLIGLCHPSSR